MGAIVSRHHRTCEGGRAPVAGRRWRYAARLVASWLPLGVFLTACTNSPSVVDPRGPAAADVANLWWLLFSIAVAVVVIVAALLLLGIFARRRLVGTGRGWIEVGGVLVPAIILVIVFVFTLGTLRALSAPAGPTGPTIEVVGHQWWWEIRYPDQHIVTANEIHIPVGQAVRVKLTSQDVIHSFWVPQLGPKMDLIPGRTNTTWFRADQPGDYRGQCAEYCGLQHAHMVFHVIAEPPDQFAAWVRDQQQPSAQPTTPLELQGEQTFLGSACVYCHTIAGTNASGQIGPDLTHLASRDTIAAGTLPNTRGNLAGWIVNPQSIKPGNLMPPEQLDPDALQALLAYLATLK